MAGGQTLGKERCAGLIDRLVASTIIGATASDVLLFTALAATTVAVVARYGLERLEMDAEMAEAVGLRVERWNTAIAIWLGILVGLSRPVGRATFPFGCRVLPALAARSLCARCGAAHVRRRAADRPGRCELRVAPRLD